MQFVDRLVNLVTGLGGSKDKRSSTSFAFNQLMRDELDAMHRSDWLSRKVVDIIPADMTREWRIWQADKDQKEALEAADKAFAVQQKVKRAMQVARLYGGAGLVIGCGSEDPMEPLDPTRVKQGDLRYLHVMNRFELAAGGDLIRDVESPWYGEPEYYQIVTNQGESQNIHPSRVVRFDGAPIINPDLNVDGWGDSILQVVYDAIQNAASSQEHVAALIPEAKVDIISVPDLAEHLSTTESTNRLIDRFTYASTIKSMFGMTLLEGNGAEGEVWQQKTLNFSAFPDILRNYLQVAAGAADIPVTRFLSQSPSGLNSTGDSDLKNYYDNIGAQQKNDLSYALMRLDEVLIPSTLGSRDPSIHYIWPSLWQQEPKELAEIEKARAETAEKLVNTGLIPSKPLSQALIASMIDSGQWPGLEPAIEEFEAASGEFDPDAGREEEEGQSQVAADAAPRTLYIRRNVVNADEIIRWAKSQGFPSTISADDLHVTIAFSRKSVDWMKTGEPYIEELTVPAGGARLMERYGDARVLLFNSAELSWRHKSVIRAGASWDHAEYQPHITISYAPDSPELDDIEPYRGRVVLGPEIYEEVDEDWATGIVEA
jgi:phage-related protein (TIGR01555 family)